VRQAYDALRFQWIKYVIQYDLDTQAELLQQLTQGLGQMGQQARDRGNWGDQLRAWLPALRAAIQQNLIPVLGLTVVTGWGGYRGRQRRYHSLQRQDYWVVALLSGIGGSLLGSLWQPQSSLGLVLVGILLPGFAFAGMRWAKPRQASPQQRIAGITHLYTQLRLTVRQLGILAPPSSGALGPGALVEALGQSSLAESERAIRLVETYLAVRFGGDPLDPQDLKQLWREYRALRHQWTQVQQSIH
jgi:hypothetical protein